MPTDTQLFYVRLLYIKAVLLGVVPFRFQLYRATLECRSMLQCYCFLVTIIGQTARLGMNLVWSWNLTVEHKFLRATAIIAYLLQSVLLALPVLYLLSRPGVMVPFFDSIKQLHLNPSLVGRLRLEKWLVKCVQFIVLFEAVYVCVAIVFGMFSNDFSPTVMRPYIVCLLMTTLSQANVQLLMYGAAQYLLTVFETFNNVLLPNEPSAIGMDELRTNLRLMVPLYAQLCECCEFFNVLFGVPIICYLLLVLMHMVTVFYMLTSTYLLGKENITLQEIILSMEEIGWATFLLLYLMRIIGTCNLVKDEVNVGAVQCWSLIGYGFISSSLVGTTLKMISDKAINRILFVSFVLGTISGNLTVTFDRKARNLQVSKILVVYSMILAFVCTALYQSTQFLLTSTRYKSGIKVTSVNLVICSIQGQVVWHTFVSSAVQRYRKRHQVAVLLKELYELKVELFSTIELGMRWMKLRILRKFTFSQWIIVSSFLLAIGELVFSDHEDLGEDLMMLCVFYYPKAAIVSSVSLHYAVMMYLQNLHYGLNKGMKQLLVEHSNGMATNTRGYARTQHSVYMRSKLNYLSDARCRIAGCCNKMHAFYDQMLLNCCFLCMTFLVTQLYHMFEILYLSYRTQSLLSVVGLVHETLNCVLCFYELYCILQACEMVQEQSRKTQTLLLRLNVTKIDHKLKQSIEVFALQTLHQPIEFTASRMFALDYTVLFSIIASVTSYLIILIQFELAVEQ